MKQLDKKEFVNLLTLNAAKTTAASIQNQINELESLLLSTPQFSIDSAEIDKLNEFIEFLDNLKGDVDSTMKVISEY